MKYSAFLIFLLCSSMISQGGAIVRLLYDDPYTLYVFTQDPVTGRRPRGDVQGLRENPKFSASPDRVQLLTRDFANPPWTLGEVGMETPGYNYSVAGNTVRTTPNGGAFWAWLFQWHGIEQLFFNIHYGDWTRGFIQAPQTGDYIFFLEADDSAEFWLSTDHDPAKKALLATQWNRARVRLEQGKIYYVEVLHKNQNVADYFRLGWRLPDGTMERPISAIHLLPFPADRTTSWQEKQPGAPLFTWPGYPGILDFRDPDASVPRYHGDGSGHPRSTNVAVGKPALFTCTVEATQPVTFQWYRNGQPIPGEQLSFLRIPAVTAADYGARFSVRAQNAQGSAESAPAVLLPPNPRGPVITGALTRGNPNGLTVTFSEPVDPVTAGTAGNYVIVPPVAVNQAAVVSSTVVQLTTGTIQEGTVYTVTAVGVRNDQASPASTPSSLQFVQVDGFVTQKIFTDIGGNELQNLITHPGFPNSPSVRRALTELESPPLSDTGGLDRYGQQLEGYLVPIHTGNYVFFIAADDQARFYLSSDSDPANKKLLAMEPRAVAKRAYLNSGMYISTDRGLGDPTNPYTHLAVWLYAGDSQVRRLWDPFWQYADSSHTPMEPISPNYIPVGPVNASLGSSAIPLVAGRKYYFEVLHKEGLGGDHVSVTWAGPGLPPVANGSPPIPSAYLSSIGFPKTPVNITTEPQDGVSAEGSTATFQVEAEGFPILSYQWLKNGTPIPNATNAVLALENVRRTDHGARLSVQVRNSFSEDVSRQAVLSVEPDAIPPQILGAGALEGQPRVHLGFSERMDVQSLANPAHYTVQMAGVQVMQAEVRPGEQGLTLSLSAPVPEGTLVEVRNLRDWAGNSMATAAVSIRGIRLSQSDVGNPTTAPLWPGQVFSWNGETFDIRGSGRDLGGTADGFSFLYREMEGDFEILTRVPVMDAPDFWVKAGLMVREDLSAGSRMAYVAVTPREGANRFYSAYRGAPGGNATLLGEFSPVPFPSAWLRIRRIGSTVMLASSNNGEHWITLGVPLVSFQPTVLVGICLAARDRDSFTASPLNATFADFKLQSIPVPALSMMFGEGMVIIRWPEWVIGSPYVLEEAEALLEDGIGWIPLNGATESTEYGVFLDPEQPVAQKFYRLSLPQF